MFICGTFIRILFTSPLKYELNALLFFACKIVAYVYFYYLHMTQMRPAHRRIFPNKYHTISWV